MVAIFSISEWVGLSVLWVHGRVYLVHRNATDQSVAWGLILFTR
jgi:hypothetical protein